eukprot:scaffold3116_cov77-Phaeocystis_antarctica.AAC.2
MLVRAERRNVGRRSSDSASVSTCLRLYCHARYRINTCRDHTLAIDHFSMSRTELTCALPPSPSVSLRFIPTRAYPPGKAYFKAVDHDDTFFLPPVPLPDGGRAGTGGRDFVYANS